jgi:hypothetical protein
LFADASGLALIPFDGQVGNLQLTAREEKDLVNFLKTLTDGYTRPNPVTLTDLSSLQTTVRALSVPGPIVIQIAGSGGQLYTVRTSTNLTDWLSVFTNILTGTTVNMTNQVIPGAARQFWRVVPQP